MPSDGLVGELYQSAKQGDWDAVLAAWRLDPAFARRCAHHAQSSSGWTFLHQAAYFGNEAACRELIRLGTNVTATGHDKRTPAAVAEQRGHRTIADMLSRAAVIGHSDLWGAPNDPDMWPSSCAWAEARKRRAPCPFIVSYGGGRVTIGEGDTYYVDSFERVLVGWHGTYNPPCGMDDYSMVDTEVHSQ